MEETLKQNLETLSAIIARADGSPSRKMGESTIWDRAVGQARFLDRLRAGSSMTLRTYDRAVEWFSNNWPSGVAWPDGIERPQQKLPKEAAE